MSTGERASGTSLRDRAGKLLQADLFAVLDVKRTATPDEVMKGFLEAVKVFHPDRAPSEDLRPLFTKVFARIELAKNTLSDPSRRAFYLQELVKPASASDQSTAQASLEFMKAESFLKTHDPVKAEQHLRRAVQLAPTNVDYCALLVSVQAAPDATQDRLTELAAELDKLIARSSDNERALFHRAQIRKRLGRVKEAMADFARVAELNPANLDATREVRIHRMRSEQSEKKPAESQGVGGVFRRIFGSKK